MISKLQTYQSCVAFSLCAVLQTMFAYASANTPLWSLCLLLMSLKLGYCF